MKQRRRLTDWQIKTGRLAPEGAQYLQSVITVVRTYLGRALGHCSKILRR